MPAVDPKNLVPANKIEGEDSKDTGLLQEMLAEAERYLLGQRWCKSVRESYFGVGVGGVVAAFLFRIEPVGDADEWLWVVVGDLPPAYLVTDQIRQPIDALTTYCELMQGWVNAVRGNVTRDDVFPVDAPRDAQHAEMLAQRIKLLREDVIPSLAAA